MGCCHSKTNTVGIDDETVTTDDPIQSARHKTNDLSVSLQHGIDLVTHATTQSNTTTETTFTDTAISKEMLLSWKTNIDELKAEIVLIEKERQLADLEYKNNVIALQREMASLKADNLSQRRWIEQNKQVMVKTNRNVNEMVSVIAMLRREEKRRRQRMETMHGALHKVAGDAVSKLKFNGKLHPKSVMFVSRMNLLFYFDADGVGGRETKRMVIRNITIDHEAINEHMDRPWFFILGEKRSALFVVETPSVRDQWVQFIADSLRLEGRRPQIAPMSIPFGHRQSPINIAVTNCDRDGDGNGNGMESGGGTESGGGHRVTPSMALPLRLEYPSEIKGTECSIINDGQTVRVQINRNSDGDHGINPRINIHDEWYYLNRIEFHTPSEHTIDGRQYEMEMHLVHRIENEEEVEVEDEDKMVVMAFVFSTASKYKKPKRTLSQSRGSKRDSIKSNLSTHSNLSSHRIDRKSKGHVHVLSESATENDTESKMAQIVSTINGDHEFEGNHGMERQQSDLNQFYIDHKEKKKENEFLKGICKDLPMEQSMESKGMSGNIHFDALWEIAASAIKPQTESDNLMEIDMEMFEYEGSLTLPPFNEDVVWLVSRRAHFIDNKQLNKLSSCWEHRSNARDLQDPFDRKIYLRSGCMLKM